MNSEELEQSLRAEFENHLKEVFSEVRREVSGFQERFDAELKEHKARVDAAFAELIEKFASEKGLDESFRDTVTEHLRLAKDEGARITAMAIAEAEELRAEHEAAQAPPARYDSLRDAIAEISSKSTQAEILKSLVNHAAEYTARGAFFIVKNEHLVGWRVFGKEDHPDPDIIRDIFFPVTSETALTEAVDSLSTVSGVGLGDKAAYLDSLGFHGPREMVAIPLVARGRGVAVLYADGGENGGTVNVEAIEALVCVAGLTVELLAAAPGSHVPAHFGTEDEAEAVPYVEEAEEQVEPAAEPKPGQQFEEPVATFEEAVESTEDYSGVSGADPGGFAFTPSDEPQEFPAGPGETDQEDIAEEPVEEFATEFEPAEEATAEEVFEAEVQKLYEVEEDGRAREDEMSFAEVAVEDEAEPVEVSYSETAEETSFEFAGPSAAVEDSAASESDEAFEYGSLEEEALKAEAEFQAEPIEGDEEAAPEAAEAPVAVQEPAVAETVPQVRPRFGDRNIDLPIEVSESDRQYHNAARRFARLLVSEIRLYNEQKVKEGCEAHDLYERLKEAIDRSRDMYEKRVHGPVAEKFDYFDYELVNSLAGGDKSKLGDSYPGSKV